MSRRHRFFCSFTCVKVYWHFPECRFRWKVEIISTFSLRKIVAFFLNQSFLRTRVNKVSDYNMACSQSQYNVKLKWLLTSTWTTMKYQKSFDLTSLTWYWTTKVDACKKTKNSLRHTMNHRYLLFVQKQPPEVFSKIWQNLLLFIIIIIIIIVGVSFRPVTLLKKPPTLVFFCEICEIFKNIYFEERLRKTASICFTSKYYSK